MSSLRIKGCIRYDKTMFKTEKSITSTRNLSPARIMFLTETMIFIDVQSNSINNIDMSSLRIKGGIRHDKNMF
jgi:hypothetical protein